MTFRSLRPQSGHGRQAEARRNDLVVLEAARDVFAAQGADAPISAVVLHNLGSREKIFSCYPVIHSVLKPGGYFLNCDRFVDGVEEHLTALRAAGFGRVECTWRRPPHATVVAARTDR